MMNPLLMFSWFLLLIFAPIYLYPLSPSQTKPQTPVEPKVEGPTITYPVRLIYIDGMTNWWGLPVADSLAVPGYSPSTIYNYVALAFWTSNGGPQDAARVWADPLSYFSTDTVFGKTKEEIQQNLKKAYNNGGVKIMVSAFGSTDFPTSAGVDPVACANNLANFVKNNNLDGVDIDWQDNNAMERGTGEEWLIKFQTQLRNQLPNHIITHAPQAPYFKNDYYKNGGYYTVHNKVGSTIDFYNVQFYNQGNTAYNTYDTLFVHSGSVFSGTAVNQIIAKGIPSKKIVIGKPAVQADASNTGYVDHNDFGKWIAQAYNSEHWYAGVMYWQYMHDKSGSAIKASTGYLKEQCAINKNCN